MLLNETYSNINALFWYKLKKHLVIYLEKVLVRLHVFGLFTFNNFDFFCLKKKKKQVYISQTKILNNVFWYQNWSSGTASVTIRGNFLIVGKKKQLHCWGNNERREKKSFPMSLLSVDVLSPGDVQLVCEQLIHQSSADVSMWRQKNSMWEKLKLCICLS